MLVDFCLPALFFYCMAALWKLPFAFLVIGAVCAVWDLRGGGAAAAGGCEKKTPGRFFFEKDDLFSGGLFVFF